MKKDITLLLLCIIVMGQYWDIEYYYCDRNSTVTLSIIETNSNLLCVVASLKNNFNSLCEPH